jgi:AraC-like DNA-binding protein
MIDTSFDPALIQKCENLLALSPSNLYVIRPEEIVPFVRMQTPALISRMITASLKKQAHALEHSMQNRGGELPLLVWIDPFRLGYVLLAVESPDGGRSIVSFGPVITERLSAEELRYIGFQMKLSSTAGKLFEAFLGTIPQIDLAFLKRVASVLAAYFLPADAAYSIQVEHHRAEASEADEPLEDAFEFRAFVDSNYAIEGKMLSAVEHGDVELVRRLLDSNIRYFNLPARYPSDPLREMKNLAITGNSILLRAAIKGGLNASIAHNMSNAYAIQIEQQKSPESAQRMILEFAMDYAEAVRTVALKNRSELMVNTVILIHRYISAPVSLSQLADELHVSHEHLSRCFHREMGTTLTAYIHQEKIRESLPLLSSRRYAVGRIAFLFGYASPSHYTKMFIRVMQCSPRAWQKAQNSGTQNG